MSGRDSTFPTNQELIDANLNLDEKLYIFARVNPAHFSAYRQEKIIGEWMPIAGTAGRRYLVGLPLDVDQDKLHSLVDDLHCLLSAYFLTDFQPRDLIDFKILTSDKNEQSLRKAVLVFGQSNFVEFPYSKDIGGEQNLIMSSRIRGMSGFDSPTRRIRFSKNYPWNELEKHYNNIKKKPDFLRKLMLIRESFMNFNHAFSSQGYVRETELLTGIIILVAALESLFLKGAKDEIRLRFSLIGAIVYERNLKQTDFRKHSFSKSKMKFKEAQEMFQALYDIRSDLAHGTLSTVLKPTDKYWQKLAQIFNVSLHGNQSFSLRMRNYAIIVTMLQYHIALLIKKSQDDLTKKPEEIFSYIKV